MVDLISSNFQHLTFLLLRGMQGKLKTFSFTFDNQFHMGSKDKFILVIFLIILIYYILLIF